MAMCCTGKTGREKEAGTQQECRAEAVAMAAAETEEAVADEKV